MSPPIISYNTRKAHASYTEVRHCTIFFWWNKTKKAEIVQETDRSKFIFEIVSYSYHIIECKKVWQNTCPWKNFHWKTLKTRWYTTAKRKLSSASSFK